MGAELCREGGKEMIEGDFSAYQKATQGLTECGTQIAALTLGRCPERVGAF